MSQSSTEYAADLSGGLTSVRRLFAGVAKIWPNDCPDCGTRMEFAFEPQTIRRCPAPECGHAIRVNPITGDFQKLRGSGGFQPLTETKPAAESRSEGPAAGCRRFQQAA